MDTRTEKSICATYRSALRNTRQNNTGMRAPERRQHARKMTVARHNVPFKMVKEIVERQDALNGITHERSPKTLMDQRFREFSTLPTSQGPCPLHAVGKWGDTEWGAQAE